jgi:hypothetical protein
MPTRSVSNDPEIVATLTFDGVGDTGTSQGETRNITAWSVTNNKTVPVFVHVEEELNKQRTFETTILPGQTRSGNIPGPGPAGPGVEHHSRDREVGRDQRPVEDSSLNGCHRQCHHDPV